MVERSYKEEIMTYANESRDSLLGRIGASTFALMRATIVQPQPNNIRANLVAISSASNKSGPSSELNNQPFNPWQENSENNNSVSDGKVGSLLARSFRTHACISSTSTTSLQHDFDMFSATPTTVPTQLLPSHETNATTQTRHGKHRRSWVGDGAEVVDLLSDTRGLVDELPDPLVDVDSFDDYLESWKPDEVDRLSFFGLGNLTAPPIHYPSSPTNPLNLLPDFDSGYNFVAKDLMITVSAKPMTIEYRLPSISSADLSSANFDSWLDVLTRYQDDVWGHMLPLVKEARAEINITLAEGGTVPKNRSAIRRLCMLLGHLNDFSNADRTYGFFASIHRRKF
ncbi:hypothetical protein MMC15_000715 [Xylographa vitiligo]|nr:hypothetical protein [Xylographa vitiligo]